MGTFPTELFIYLSLPYLTSFHSHPTRTFPWRASSPYEFSAFMPRLPENKPTDRPTGYSSTFLPTRGFISDFSAQISLRRI